MLKNGQKKWSKSYEWCEAFTPLTCLNPSCASHHTVHEDELQLVFVEGLVAVLVVGCPDVTGDGSRHSSIGVSITGVRQEGPFIVQQAGEKNKTNMFSSDERLYIILKKINKLLYKPMTQLQMYPV